MRGSGSTRVCWSWLPPSRSLRSPSRRSGTFFLPPVRAEMAWQARLVEKCQRIVNSSTRRDDGIHPRDSLFPNVVRIVRQPALRRAAHHEQPVIPVLVGPHRKEAALIAPSVTIIRCRPSWVCAGRASVSSMRMASTENGAHEIDVVSNASWAIEVMHGWTPPVAR